ncbi:glycosyltransferase family 2 protein [Pseudotenacibaculum sp. MALMAid0570]|uniref:glycosyltransferase family 2 protein n=1 Tax=Pseudotenacibaculum sp. MALMAid0570 TaxID=3143938 RepID=UPI0032DE3E15
MTKITAIIPTFNEEERIKNSLKSAEFADEIIVIDSYSTDNTIEIVKESNAVLLQRKFDDFSSQKNYAIEKASNDWIVWIDADEVLTQELQDEIKLAIQNAKELVGFYIYRVFFFKGKRMRYTGTQNDKLIRVFNRQYCKYEGKVHEKIVPQGKVGVLQNRILHYSYISFDRYIVKLNQHSALKAEELFEKGLIITPFHIVIKPFARFIKHYFIKLGILDGFYGFIISFALSYGVLVRYIKLWNLKQKQRKNEKLDK